MFCTLELQPFKTNSHYHVNLADNRKSSISAFQEISTSTDNSFTLGGGLSTSQLFYEVLRFS